MKLLHVSDLHLGKRLHGQSLAEDQEHLLGQMLALAARPDCDGVLIAGDIYNRAQPQPEAIAQFSAFLTRLAALSKPVFIVRGNHDGEAQLAYAAPLLAGSGIHVSEAFAGEMGHAVLRDAFGELHVWLLPFLRPVQVRRCYPDAAIESYADAVREVIRRAGIDPGVRNVLVTHYYVSGAEVSDSEERIVGGLDQIPAELFAPFDYVALGHLHKAQTLCDGRLRYPGAPMPYSFDECAQPKSATLVSIGPKGAPNAFEFAPLAPLHAVRRVEGTLEELAVQPRSEAYVQAVLTGPGRPLDPIGTLRLTYPNLLNLLFVTPDGARREEPIPFQPDATPLDHFVSFYTAQNGQTPTEAQIAAFREVLAKEVALP